MTSGLIDLPVCAARSRGRQLRRSAGANLLGIAGEAGSIEPGKRADVIAVAGDPLSDVTVLKRVSFVMKDGKVYKQ